MIIANIIKHNIDQRNPRNDKLIFIAVNDHHIAIHQNIRVKNNEAAHNIGGPNARCEGEEANKNTKDTRGPKQAIRAPSFNQQVDHGQNNDAQHDKTDHTGIIGLNMDRLTFNQTGFTKALAR